MIMKITSRAGDYALLLVMYLARLAVEETTSIKKVTEALKLSNRFLANIANKLSIARIVVSHRGIGGGIKLARPASQIKIREVIEAVEGPIQTMFCQNTLEMCGLEAACTMKHFWNDLQDLVMNKLTTTTVEDLIKHHGASPAFGPYKSSPHEITMV